MISPSSSSTVSDCCQAPMKVVSAYEGTSYYLCTKCQQPCDQYVSSSSSLDELVRDIMQVPYSKSKAKQAIQDLIDSKVVERVDELVTEVLGYYAEDVFTRTTDDDTDKFNSLNPNAHTRIHCGGIRHGLHQLRRAARDLSPREDLEVIHVPKLN